MDLRHAGWDPVAGHPFAAVRGMEWCGHSQGRVNQVTLDRVPRAGESDPQRPRVLAVSGSGSRRSGAQGADMPVAQPVEHQREKFRPAATLPMLDPRRAPTRNPSRADRAAAEPLHRLNRGPAQQRTALNPGCRTRRASGGHSPWAKCVRRRKQPENYESSRNIPSISTRSAAETDGLGKP